MSKPPTHPFRVLLVDDDEAVRRAFSALFTRHGLTVETASNGSEAIARAKAEPFDVVVSDVSMPGMSGIDFLKAARASGLDAPVILVTGQPELASAIPAVEHGAFRYLVKPIRGQELLEVTLHAARLHTLAKLKEQALQLPGADRRERDVLGGRFTSAMSRMWMAFQPIVAWRERRVFGYEALLRSDDPTMKSPGDVIDAALRLGRIHELGRAVRARVARDFLDCNVAGAKIFVNLHSADLNDESLFAPDAPLTQIASRVVLEVTERESLDRVCDLEARVESLRALGFEIAVDDLGAGFSGLTSFTRLKPEVVKLDMSLVRGVDVDKRRQTIIRSMKTLCDQLGVAVIAEGVETAGERDALCELTCDLFQGYLFAKPQRTFSAPTW